MKNLPHEIKLEDCLQKKRKGGRNKGRKAQKQFDLSFYRGGDLALDNAESTEEETDQKPEMDQKKKKSCLGGNRRWDGERPHHHTSTKLTELYRI